MLNTPDAAGVFFVVLGEAEGSMSFGLSLHSCASSVTGLFTFAGFMGGK